MTEPIDRNINMITGGEGPVDGGQNGFGTNPSNFATFYVRRDADYVGGSAGYVNAAIKAHLYVTSGVSDYEWAIVGVCNNQAISGQNVGIYGQGNKTTAGAGPTWGQVAEINEKVEINNPVTQSVALEVDVRSNGTDNSGYRIGVDVHGIRYNTASSPTETTYGVRVTNDNDSSSLIKTAFCADTLTNIAFDASRSDVMQNAFKMDINDSMAFDSSGRHLLTCDLSGIVYTVASTRISRLNADGGLALNTTRLVIKGSWSTGSTSAVLTNNKPGSATDIGTWLSITIDGTQYWIPAWSN